MTVIEIQSIRCGSTDPRAIKAAKGFPSRLALVSNGTIVLHPEAVYFHSQKRLRVLCTVCGHDWMQLPGNLLRGDGCRPCSIKAAAHQVGVKRSPRATAQEKADATRLFEELGTYRAVGRILGREPSTIRYWLRADVREKECAYAQVWAEQNRARRRCNGGTYRYFDPRNRELLLVDDLWSELDHRETWRVFGEVLLPAKERKAIQELYLEAQYITETTGVEHQVDHIQPLSKGGEHLMYNLQILPASENRSKNDTFREEDQIELARRLFS